MAQTLHWNEKSKSSAKTCSSRLIRWQISTTLRKPLELKPRSSPRMYLHSYSRMLYLSLYHVVSKRRVGKFLPSIHWLFEKSQSWQKKKRERSVQLKSARLKPHSKRKHFRRKSSCANKDWLFRKNLPKRRFSVKWIKWSAKIRKMQEERAIVVELIQALKSSKTYRKLSPQTTKNATIKRRRASQVKSQAHFLRTAKLQNASNFEQSPIN